MSSTIRIGIIGCGRILNAHLRGFKILLDSGYTDFRIAALCARKEIDLQRFRKRGEGPPPRPAPVPNPHDPLNAPQMYVSDLHPGQDPELYTDYREMLAKGSVDAVCIYTGHDNHHSIALDALRAGKHVAVEKPMAITVKACQRMCEAAEDAGKVLGVLENAHYQPLTQASAWAVQNGAIGSVALVFQSAIVSWAERPDAVSARTPWRDAKLAGGGGIALDLGPHIFNRIRTIAGPIQRLSAVSRVIERERVVMDDANEAVVDRIGNEVEDVFLANFAFDNGAIGHASVSKTAHGVQLVFPGGTNVWGSQGALSAGEIVSDAGQKTSVMDYAKQHAPSDVIDSWQPQGITDAFALEGLDFIQAVQGGRPMRMSGEEGRLDVTLSYAVLESSILRRAVTPTEVLSGDVREYQREMNEHFGL